MVGVSMLCCESRSSANKRRGVEQHESSKVILAESAKLETNNVKPQIKFYLENSGSMFGYVSGGGSFVNVVSQLAGDCDLESESVNYSLINGKETKVGSELSKFTNCLSVSGIKKGDPSTSDLNQIFNKALAHAGNGKISILISDGIYSVNGTASQLITDLKSQSVLTRNNFVKRLREENLTTHLIKLSSNFSGYYYPAQGGQVRINQVRPYYIWVIGNERDVKSVFPENYFVQLQGFESIVKFVKLQEQKPACGLLTHGKKGSYRYNSNDLAISNVEPRRLETAFSLAFDFSQIPLPSTYFDQLEVYENSLGYTTTQICHVDQISSAAKASLQACAQKEITHIVTFEKRKAPWGQMDLKIKNIKPVWINHTHVDDDSDVKNQDGKTFGFKYLIKGINDAYVKVNDSENLAEYTIKITK